VYKLFHSEETSISLDPDCLEGVVTNEPGTGHQNIFQSLLKSSFFKFHLSVSSIELKERRLFAPFSFFLTGGASRPLPAPEALIFAIQTLEEFIPDKFLRYIASRQFCVIQKLNMV